MRKGGGFPALHYCPPLGKGAEGTRDADCHDQFANWSRNDTFSRSAVGFFVVRRGGALPLPRAGKSPKRCRWQKKRGGFEEVPRLAATTVAGNRLARRWAREPRPYGSATRGAMGGRPQGSPLRITSKSLLRADVGIGPYGGLQGVPCGWADRGVRPLRVGCRGWVTLLVRAVCGASGGNHRDGCGFFWYL